MQTGLTAPHVSACSTSPDCEIAVIVPVYKGEAFLSALVERLHAALQRISASYQIILVDDRSPDASWPMIVAASEADGRVVGVRLSRNFGQHPAISAGIAHASAQWYVVMDCDLQDPPEQLVELYQAAKDTGDDIVVAERETSGLGADRNLGSSIFNGVLRWASDMDVSSRHGNFRIFSDKVATAFRAYPEQLRFFPALMSHLGFKQGKLLLSRAERATGKSSYTFGKLIRLALENIIAYSEKPLWLSIFFSLLVCGASAAFALLTLIRAVFFGFDVPGFATIAILVSFIGGIHLFLMSLVGLYVGRAIVEVRRRPIFIVEQIAKTDGST